MISILFPTKKQSKVAQVYDPLGLVSSCTLADMLLYQEACESKVGWDAQLHERIVSGMCRKVKKQAWKQRGVS